jgi:DNA-binding transcriptional MerR regulator
MTQDSRFSRRPGSQSQEETPFKWTLSDAFSRLMDEMVQDVVPRDDPRRNAPGIQAPASRRIPVFEGVYVISVAARIVEMHPNTLRKYDREGLVSPLRSEGRQRLYSDVDVRRLRVVRTLADKYNLNIDGVKLVLDLVQLMSGVAEILETSPDVSATRTARAASSELRRVLGKLGA